MVAVHKEGPPFIIASRPLMSVFLKQSKVPGVGTGGINSGLVQAQQLFVTELSLDQLFQQVCLSVLRATTCLNFIIPSFKGRGTFYHRL